MSSLTAQQIYERTRGKDSRENVEKRNLKAFGHIASGKQKNAHNNTSKSKALSKAKGSAEDNMMKKWQAYKKSPDYNKDKHKSY